MKRKEIYRCLFFLTNQLKGKPQAAATVIDMFMKYGMCFANFFYTKHLAESAR